MWQMESAGHTLFAAGGAAGRASSEPLTRKSASRTAQGRDRVLQAAYCRSDYRRAATVGPACRFTTLASTGHNEANPPVRALNGHQLGVQSVSLSAMASLSHLDDRQRAVLSLALIAAGLVLLAGGTAGQAVGIGLSGLAIAWAIGQPQKRKLRAILGKLSGLAMAWAIAQPSWLNLNRRHRAVISLTILASGLGLVAGYGFKISLGVASLGLGLAWAIGSNCQLVHALFLLCGVSLITGPLILDWRNHLIQTAEYNQRLADHKNRLEGFRLKALQFANCTPCLRKASRLGSLCRYLQKLQPKRMPTRPFTMR